jgi:VWFA-related protein
MPQKLAALLLCLLLANPLPAQDTDKRDVAATLNVQVKVVTLPVTVRDKHGAIVNTLTKDDFTLAEDGRPQSIRYFTQEKNLPLTLGLLVDTSLSQRNVLDEERTASKKFLDDMLTETKDQAFLIHFDREVELLEDLTPSREKLRAALEDLHTPPMDRGASGGSNDPNDPDSRSARRAGTLLYDAIYLASDELMKKQKGRKALIILTDGVDRGSKKTLEEAVEAAQRADTVVYTVLFTGEERSGFARGGDRDHDSGGRRGGGWPGGGGGGWPGGGTGWPGGGGGGRRPSGGGGGGQRRPEEPRADGKKTLEQIARETGGRLYQVSKKEKIDQIYSSIAEELRTQYSLAYTPDKESSGSGYHRITLTTNKKDLTVQTREGYYAD